MQASRVIWFSYKILWSKSTKNTTCCLNQGILGGAKRHTAGMGMLALLEFKTGNFMNINVEGMDKEL
jgi:hypothetical protein